MEISNLGDIKTIMILIGFDQVLLTVSLIQRLKPIESLPNQIKQQKVWKPELKVVWDTLQYFQG